MPWYVWVILAVAAIFGEALTLSLVLGSVAVAALLAAALTTVSPLPVQIAVFCAASLVLILAVRPLALGLVARAGSSDDTPQVGPTGHSAVAEVTIDSRGGQIRVGRGEFWSARAASPECIIAAGQAVDVVRMEGLIALVRPMDAPLASIPKRLPLVEDDVFGLSAREVEVLRLVAAGMSNQEIADQLVLSPRTVHHHVSHIFTKMGVDSRVDAARLAIQRGMVVTERLEE